MKLDPDISRAIPSPDRARPYLSKSDDKTRRPRVDNALRSTKQFSFDDARTNHDSGACPTTLGSTATLVEVESKSWREGTVSATETFQEQMVYITRVCGV